jgi:hypothetical protein
MISSIESSRLMPSTSLRGTRMSLTVMLSSAWMPGSRVRARAFGFVVMLGSGSSLFCTTLALRANGRSSNRLMPLSSQASG